MKTMQMHPWGRGGHNLEKCTMRTAPREEMRGGQVQPWVGGTDGPDNPGTRPKRCTFATESKPTKEDIIEINVRASAATTLNRQWGGCHPRRGEACCYCGGG